MGKPKSERSLPDRDAYVRMNFLHQAAHLTLGLSDCAPCRAPRGGSGVDTTSNSTVDSSGEGQASDHRQLLPSSLQPSLEESLPNDSARPAHALQTLSRFYVSEMKNITKRLVLRVDPEIKRTLCKGCGTLLVPGATAAVRLRTKRETHRVVTCTVCGRFKRFPNKVGHKIHRSATVVHTISAQPPGKTGRSEEPDVIT